MLLASTVACSAPEAGQRDDALAIASAAFHNNGTIPAKYTCDGGETTPPLSFSGVPPDAKTLALVVDDPDAPGGTWDHWVIWNIPPGVREIAEGAVPAGVVGRNSWQKNGWGGPCPPEGAHRYRFRLIALDAQLALPVDGGTAQLEQAMKGHVLGESVLTARYERAR